MSEQVRKADAQLEWATSNATQLDAVVRAFNPRPVAYTWLLPEEAETRGGDRGEYLRIFVTEPLHLSADHSGISSSKARGGGVIVAAGEEGIDVLAGGGGIVRLKEVQPENGQRMSAAEYCQQQHRHGQRRWRQHQRQLKHGKEFQQPSHNLLGRRFGNLTTP